MASTLRADMFVPELATEVATAEFPNELALGFAGAPFVEIMPPVDDLGQEGDQVKFPRWNPLGEFDDLTEDVAMTPEKLNTSTDIASVVVGGKALEITDWADLAARGDPSMEAGRQIAARAAYYLDTKLIPEAQSTPLLENHAGTVTWNAFVDALINNWGDRAWQNIGGIVVHSKVHGDLAKLNEWKNNDFGNIADFRPGEQPRGAPVGALGGYPVWVSDRLTVTDGSPDTYTNLILKRGALGVMFQRQLLVESDRDILKKSDVIAADVRFAVHLLFGEPMPAIRFITQ